MELVRRVGLSPNVRKKQIPTKGRIFGVHLDNLIEKCENGSGVPDIVYQCVNYITQYGLKEEGLFRISGNRRHIDQLHSEYDTYGTGDLSRIQDISVVTSLFKMFFRELPDPLVCDQVSQEILLAADDHNLSIADVVGRITKCCKNLPDSNFTCLSYLCGFLAEVGKHVTHTKMTDSSLAIVFGPNLFRIKDDLEALHRQPAITRAMCCMITHHEQIFSKKEPVYSTVNKKSNVDRSVIQVSESPNNQQPNSARFILPNNTVTNNKENIVNNKVANSNTKNGRDWDDAWLSTLTQDSPSPETEDILARSHDSLSSMSPLTGSGNLSVQLGLQQTVKECIWEMLIPTPNTSEHSFSVNYQPKGNRNTPYQSNDNVRRKGPRPDYLPNRNSCVVVDSLRSKHRNNVILKPNEFERSPSSSPQPVDLKAVDDLYNFDYLNQSQPLESLTKGRASPQKRRQVSRSEKPLGSPPTDYVPKLNLTKLNNVEHVKTTGSSTCLSDTRSPPSTKDSPSTLSVTSLSSKIYHLKQQVQNFDKSFEKSHGRLPVGNERRPISATIKELNELKRRLVTAKSADAGKGKGNLENQFSAINEKLEEKRKVAGRPRDLNLMSRAQLMDEKLCIQKLLLYFEETYGRPKTKDQKDTMRPIYDRYRKVKVGLNKLKCDSGPSEGDKTPTQPHQLGDTWNITLGTSQTSAGSGMELINFTPQQLTDKLFELQEDKRVLRKTLRDYEKAFLLLHGRKVLKDDRGPRDCEYNEYKKVKAKIRLIETLLKRSDGSATI